MEYLTSTECAEKWNMLRRGSNLQLVTLVLLGFVDG